MTERETETDPEAGTLWDAPNQQVVRPDESHPSDEGDGGSIHAAPKPDDEREAQPEPDQPVKRGPGRPRKTPPPEAESET